MATQTLTANPDSSTSQAHLKFSDRSELYPLAGGATTIGTGPKCNLRLDAQGLRPLHCVITQDQQGVKVRRWAAGALLNGRPFTEEPLSDGDCLRLGELELWFHLGSDEQSPLSDCQVSEQSSATAEADTSDDDTDIEKDYLSVVAAAPSGKLDEPSDIDVPSGDEVAFVTEPVKESANAESNDLPELSNDFDWGVATECSVGVPDEPASVDASPEAKQSEPQCIAPVPAHLMKVWEIGRQAQDEQSGLDLWSKADPTAEPESAESMEACLLPEEKASELHESPEELESEVATEDGLGEPPKAAAKADDTATKSLHDARSRAKRLVHALRDERRAKVELCDQAESLRRELEELRQQQLSTATELQSAQESNSKLTASLSELEAMMSERASAVEFPVESLAESPVEPVDWAGETVEEAPTDPVAEPPREQATEAAPSAEADNWWGDSATEAPAEPTAPTPLPSETFPELNVEVESEAVSELPIHTPTADESTPAPEPLWASTAVEEAPASQAPLIEDDLWDIERQSSLASTSEPNPVKGIEERAPAGIAEETPEAKDMWSVPSSETEASPEPEQAAEVSAWLDGFDSRSLTPATEVEPPSPSAPLEAEIKPAEVCGSGVAQKSPFVDEVAESFSPERIEEITSEGEDPEGRIPAAVERQAIEPEAVDPEPVAPRVVEPPTLPNSHVSQVETPAATTEALPSEENAPTNFEAPKSFYEQYSHLLPSDDDSLDAAPAIPQWEAPQPAEPIAPPPEPVQVGESAQDEEDIDSYMSKLLDRMRTGAAAVDSPTEAPADKPNPTPAASTPEPQPAAPAAAPLASLEELKRSVMPEQSTDMNSLRQLANQSARHAIGVAASKQNKEKSLANLIIGAIAMACGGYLVVSAQSVLSTQLIAGSFAMLLAGVWMFRSVAHLVTALRSGSFDSKPERETVTRESLPIAR